METGGVEEREQKNIDCIHKSQLIDLTNLNFDLLRCALTGHGILCGPHT